MLRFAAACVVEPAGPAPGDPPVAGYLSSVVLRLMQAHCPAATGGPAIEADRPTPQPTARQDDRRAAGLAAWVGRIRDGHVSLTPGGAGLSRLPLPFATARPAASPRDASTPESAPMAAASGHPAPAPAGRPIRLVLALAHGETLCADGQALTLGTDGPARFSASFRC